MVNHVRTLLLNESQSSLSAMGLDYGRPWYVSPSFSSVEIPKNLERIHKALFIGSFTVEERADRVDAVMSLLHSVDMSGFLSLSR